jgi:DNA-binding NtrC family response regulator
VIAEPASDEDTRAQARARVTVLVVDDEQEIRDLLRKFLAGYRTLTAGDGGEALAVLESHHVDVVILDLRLPDTSGLELLRLLRDRYAGVEVIMMTGNADLKNAVEAGRRGAFEFLAKSLDSYAQIDVHIERALEHRRESGARRARAAEQSAERFSVEGLRSPPMLEILETLRGAAADRRPVFFEGERGTGKEHLARYLHALAGAASPFVPVRLGTIASASIERTLFGWEPGAFPGAERRELGLFELADGGTLFLDEFGQLAPATQVKVLEAIDARAVWRLGAVEPRPLDVRLVMASRQSVRAEVRRGRFAAELWRRRDLVHVRVPPLRLRKDDIPGLVERFVAVAREAAGAPETSFSRNALKILRAYEWPGNVRELESLVVRLVEERAGQTIRASDIPVENSVDHWGNQAAWMATRRKAKGASLYVIATKHFERYFVKHMVSRCGGNMSEAARQLGVSYTTVKNKVYGWAGSDPGIDADDED